MSLRSSSGLPGGTSIGGRLQVDQLGPLCGILLRDQLRDRQLAERRIGVELGPIGKGQLLGLDEQVKPLGTAGAHPADIVRLDQVEHLQGGDALAVGRQFPDVVAAVVGRDRLDPFGRVIGQVLERHVAAVRLGIVDDLPGDLAAVERRRAVLGDRAIARRQVGIAEDLAFGRRMAVDQIGLGRVGILLQPS